MVCLPRTVINKMLSRETPGSSTIPASFNAILVEDDDKASLRNAEEIHLPNTILICQIDLEPVCTVISVVDQSRYNAKVVLKAAHKSD